MIIYIGNVPKDFKEDELIEMFEEYGIVKNAKIIRDRYTKISRGFGFIEMDNMDNKDVALKAVEEWNQGSIR